jgi:dipeptidyl aminopeptidase/acylaminoacyl peptidase
MTRAAWIALAAPLALAPRPAAAARPTLLPLPQAVAGTPGAAADTTPPHTTFQLEDLRRLVQVGSPEISPDGRSIAVVVSRPDWDAAETRSELDLVDVASGAMRPLTYRRDGVGSPRWSPDGTRLAFTAPDTATKKSQLWVLRMDGGDAVRITDSKTGVSAYSWSPDGASIAYVAQDSVPDPKAIQHHEDGFVVGDANYQTRAAVQPWHLWTVPSEGGKAKRLTTGDDFSLAFDQGGANAPAWSPEGSSIVFTRYPGVWFGNAYRSRLAQVDTTVAASDSTHGEVTLAVGMPDTVTLRIGTTGDTLVTGEGAGGPVFAPRGGALAWSRARGGDMNNGNAVYVMQGGAVRDVTRGLARNINGFRWMPDGRSFLLTGDLGTRTVMWEQPVDASARLLDLGDVHVAGGAPTVSDDGAIAFVGATAGHPGELYYMASVDGRPKRLTNLNAFVDSLHIGRTDSITWKGPDGFQEDGVLTYPPDARPGEKLPLVLVIHGGPEGASTTTFSDLPQLLAAHGYLVFQPNYRGSINRGDAYQHAIYRDTGEGPGKDVMAGLAAVEKLGVVDPARIGVSGWSYGGYMTTWLTGHYDRWKAAMAGAPLTDWVMDYTIAFYQKGDLYFFGSGPWTKANAKIWREQSPIQYAANVTAPTLVMGNIGDPNVPIVNAFEWYHAIRDNGVETQFVAYPANVHFSRDIRRMTDVYRRWIAWMDDHLGRAR